MDGGDRIHYGAFSRIRHVNADRIPPRTYTWPRHVGHFAITRAPAQRWINAGACARESTRRFLDPGDALPGRSACFRSQMVDDTKIYLMFSFCRLCVGV